MPMTDATQATATQRAVDRIGGETMGTTWSVRLVAPGRDLHALHACAQSCLDRIVAQMSHWEGDSDLSRFNRAARGWMHLPDELVHVLHASLEVARTSEGAFDPTLGELAALWGFGPQGAVDAPPHANQVEGALQRCGWQRLDVRTDRGEAFQPGGLQLDLSAIAKGHAADAVAQAMRASGVTSALVEVGGELHGYGRKPDGTPWAVLVETAHEREDTRLDADIVALEGRGIATSGDRWHRFAHAGGEYAHTLDPRTGRPLDAAPLAVTVVANDAMHADAWATALSVLQPARAIPLAERLGIAARIVLRGATEPEVVKTPAFPPLLVS